MTLDDLLSFWETGEGKPYKGSLIDYPAWEKSGNFCEMCAQGQVLHLLGGMSADDLRRTAQPEADRRTAELLGISRTHAVLLRKVNDGQPGAPTCVIRNPEKVLGDQAQTVLAFWRHIDRMTADDWSKVEAARAAAWASAREAAREAAWAAAGEAAREAARAAAWEAAREAAREAAWAAAGDAARAAWASNEIQGAAVMRSKGQALFFLPIFGFANPEAVLAAEEGKSDD